MDIKEIEKNFELKSVMDFIKEVKRESRMDIEARLKQINANSHYGLYPRRNRMTIADITKRIRELSNKQGLLTEQEESDLYEMQGIINRHREEAFNDYLNVLQHAYNYDKIRESEIRHDSICDISNDIDKILERQFKLKYPELFHDEKEEE